MEPVFDVIVVFFLKNLEIIFPNIKDIDAFSSIVSGSFYLAYGLLNLHATNGICQF